MALVIAKSVLGQFCWSKYAAHYTECDRKTSKKILTEEFDHCKCSANAGYYDVSRLLQVKAVVESKSWLLCLSEDVHAYAQAFLVGSQIGWNYWNQTRGPVWLPWYFMDILEIWFPKFKNLPENWRKKIQTKFCFSSRIDETKNGLLLVNPVYDKSFVDKPILEDLWM